MVDRDRDRGWRGGAWRWSVRDLDECDDPIRCGPRVAVGGDQLECEPAVQAALAILPTGHPPIALVTFNHSCNDMIMNSVPDCAIQMSGTVEVTFVDGSPPVQIAVGLDSVPSILPSLPILSP